MNILEFRHFEQKIKNALKAGLHKHLKISTPVSQQEHVLLDIDKEECILGKRKEVSTVEEKMKDFFLIARKVQ